MENIRDMEKLGRPVFKRKGYRKWIVPVLVVLLLAAIFLIWQSKQQETEYTIIQAVIEELPDYQAEIEGWGYQVSVLPQSMKAEGDEGLMRYYRESAGPVLALTDPEGGRYCFYYGLAHQIKAANEGLLI